MNIHPAAHGFAKGRSIFTNAEPHVGQRLVVAMDLRDFFPTITFKRVVGLFKAAGFEQRTAIQLAAICTFEGKLPQGAPTSPAISNLVCRRLDARLSGLMAKHGYAYTRYADDLTFSGDERLLRLTPLVREIVRDEGFEEAPEKRRLQRSGSRQRVTGLNVNTTVSVRRCVRRLVRAMVQTQAVAPHPDRDLVPHLYGYLALMQVAHPTEAEMLRAKLRAAANG